MNTNTKSVIGLYDRVQLTKTISSEFPPRRTLPTGLEGVIVECYTDPESYAVDIDIPDETLVGGYDMENVILRPDEFILIKKNTRPEPEPKY